MNSLVFIGDKKSHAKAQRRQEKNLCTFASLRDIKQLARFRQAQPAQRLTKMNNWRIP
jgi:hypothetical protein